MVDHKNTGGLLDQLSLRERGYIRSYLNLKGLIDQSEEPNDIIRLGEVAYYLAGKDCEDLFFDLFIWAGLKNDTPDMAADYRKGLLDESGLIEYIWDIRQRKVEDSRTIERPMTKERETATDAYSPEIGRIRLISNALVELVGGASKGKARLERIYRSLRSCLVRALPPNEGVAFDNVVRAIFQSASFFASWHTFNRWRALVSDLPHPLNSHHRRRVRNAIDHITWPDDKCTRAAKQLKQELIYND